MQFCLLFWWACTFHPLHRIESVHQLFFHSRFERKQPLSFVSCIFFRFPRSKIESRRQFRRTTLVRVLFVGKQTVCRRLASQIKLMWFNIEWTASQFICSAWIINGTKKQEAFATCLLFSHRPKKRTKSDENMFVCQRGNRPVMQHCMKYLLKGKQKHRQGTSPIKFIGKTNIFRNANGDRCASCATQMHMRTLVFKYLIKLFDIINSVKKTIILDTWITSSTHL